jgi:hypothetical protein
MLDGPLTPEGLRVCAEMCSTCIFRPGNRMELREGRVAGMVKEAIANDSFIPCHVTLDGQRAVCRGFWNGYRTMTLGCRLGMVMGLIEVSPDGH